MDDFSESVMIALVPTSTEWSTIDLPHLTLVYAGEKKDLGANAFSDLVKDTAMLAMLSGPIGLRVTRKDVFGSDRDTDVWRLQPTPELMAMRRAVESWNKSEHPFDPHVAIGPAGSFVAVPAPNAIYFNRLTVGWGNEYIVFNLTRPSY